MERIGTVRLTFEGREEREGDGVAVCGCEEVSAGAIREAVAMGCPGAQPGEVLPALRDTIHGPLPGAAVRADGQRNHRPSARRALAFGQRALPMVDQAHA